MSILRIPLHVFAAFPLLSTTALAETPSIRIDFSKAAGPTKGNYNVIHGKGQTGVTSIRHLVGTYSLIDSAGAAAGSLTLSSRAQSSWGDTLPDGLWSGPKPSELSGIPSSVTNDGIFISPKLPVKPVIELAFSGLVPNQHFAVLFYGSRSQTGGAGTYFTVTEGAGQGAQITNTLKNSSQVGKFMARSNAQGKLTLECTAEGKRTANVSALNYLSLTPTTALEAKIPHDTTASLISLGEMRLMLNKK